MFLQNETIVKTEVELSGSKYEGSFCPYKNLDDCQTGEDDLGSKFAVKYLYSFFKTCTDASK